MGCQEMHSKKEMIRVIRTADQEFMLDATGRKNGRGLIFAPAGNVWRKPGSARAWERSFGQAIPPEVYESLEKEMELLESE